MAWKFGMGFSWGYIFVQGFFWVLFEALGIFFSVEQRHDGCVSRTLRPINAKKIAPVLYIMFRGQLVT